MEVNLKARLNSIFGINSMKRGKRYMIIKVKYLAEGVEHLKKITVGDWIDLRSAIDVTMESGDYKVIPLGVAMELPVGFEAHIVPRSSTFKNYGVIQTNGMGVIDYSYKGDNDEWRFPCYATRHTVIHKNDRLCQFRVMPCQTVLQFEEVEFLGNKDRGGIGSTGKSDFKYTDTDSIK